MSSSEDRLELSNKYKKVFSGDDGQAVLEDILSHGKYFPPDVVLHEKEHITIANAGRQALASYILGMVGIDSNFLIGHIRKRSQQVAERKPAGGYSHV